MKICTRLTANSIGFGDPNGGSMGDVLPTLIGTAESVRGEAVETSPVR
jgi:hypothetical protein